MPWKAGDPLMTQPKQKPGNSSGVFRTPDDFRQALRTRFGEFAFDFAADESNTLAPTLTSPSAPTFINRRHFTEADDALRPDRHWADYLGLGELGFLNPPFSKIAPWAEKCWQTAQAGGSLVFLVPAAVGSNWFSQYVHHKARVLFLNGRLHFMPDRPNDPYPKDLMLCLYGPTFNVPSVDALPYDVWRWKGPALRSISAPTGPGTSYKALNAALDANPSFQAIRQQIDGRTAEILRGR